MQTCFIGLLAGLVGKLLVPSRNQSEWLVTIILSIAAAIITLVAGQWSGMFGHVAEADSFYGAVAGAIVILLIYKLILKRKKLPSA